MLDQMQIMTKLFARDKQDPNWERVREIELDIMLQQQAQTPDQVNASFLAKLSKEMRMEEDHDDQITKQPKLIEKKGTFTYHVDHEAIKELVTFTGLRKNTVLVKDWELAGHKHDRLVTKLMAKKKWETILSDDEEDLDGEAIISEIKNLRHEKYFNTYFNQVDNI